MYYPSLSNRFSKSWGTRSSASYAAVAGIANNHSRFAAITNAAITIGYLLKCRVDGSLLPLPLFLRFSRGTHKQVGKLRRIPGGVTFLSGLTGRPSRNRERSVKPRRDLWSVAVG